MTTTLLLLVFALLFSPISLQFAESTEYVVPVEESTVAVEEYIFPTEESTVAIEEYIAPTEESTVAVEEYIAPTEESTVAVEEYIAPTEESTVVVEESVVPIEESTTPTEEQPSHFLALDVSQYLASPDVQGLLYIGAQDATQQAIQAGLLPSGTYQVSRVKSIERNTDVPINSNIEDYRFFVDVVNGQGDKRTILFEIRYDPAEGNPTVISYSIAEPGTEDIVPGYVPLDLSVARTDPQVQGLLQTGMKNATGQAIEAGSLLNGTYYVAQINSIMQNLDVVVFLVKYRFDVNISSFDAYNISNLVFEVTADPSSGPPEVISYSVKNTPTTEETYTPLDLTAIKSNPKIQGLVYVGAMNVVQQAIQSGSLLNGTFQVDHINSAAQGTLNPENYQFTVSIIDHNDGTTADIFFNLTNKDISEAPEILYYSLGANSTTTTNTTTTDNELPEGYRAIDMNSDEGHLAFGIAEDGFQIILPDTIYYDEIPSSDYQFSRVSKAGRRADENQDSYWFDVEATDSLGNIAEFIYVMIKNPESGNYQVSSYEGHKVERPS